MYRVVKTVDEFKKAISSHEVNVRVLLCTDAYADYTITPPKTKRGRYTIYSSLMDTTYKETLVNILNPVMYSFVRLIPNKAVLIEKIKQETK
jgi:hypothetical protein